MFYKLIVLLPALLFSLSCSEFLKSTKKKDEVLQFEDSRLDCLDTATDTIKKFDRSTTTPLQLQSSLQCFQSSLEYFISKTKASVDDPNNYTTDNLRKFFGKFLGDDTRVSENMAQELMRLKAALFGGSSVSMSKSELLSLISFSETLQVEIDQLKPYWSLLLITKESDQHPIELINKGQAQLLQSLNNLLKKTELPNSDYSLDNFTNLIFEVEKFINIEKPSRFQLDAWMKLVKSTKNILFGNQIEIDTYAKWKEAIRMVSEIHRFYMLYTFQFNQFQIYSKQGIRSGDEILVLTLKLLESSWVLKSSEILFADTKSFFYALAERNLLPENITGQAVDEFYRSIVIKVLERESLRPDQTVIGLNQKHLATLKNEYEIWKSTQNFIDQFPDVFDYDELKKRIETYQVVQESVFSISQPKVISEAWQDWKHHLTEQKIPLLYLPTGELRLVSHVKKIKDWPWYSLARLNVMRTLARSLMLGYGINRTAKMAEEKLNEKSLVDWYDDYKLLGEQMKAFDPRGGNSGARSFFEANQFTMAGNGDSVVDRQEVFEFVNIIFSSGLSGLKGIQYHMTARGCNLLEKDVYDNPWIEEACFKKQLKVHFSRFFKNLTGLHQYVSAMNTKQWDEFYVELMNFSRNPINQPGKIETSDIRTLVVILHYIESMYIQFDLDQDDRLSKEELTLASSRFVEFFKAQYSLKSNPDTLLDDSYKYAVSQGFACMVLTGKIPTVKSCTKVFLQDWWEDRYSDRLRILKTLNQLKVQVQ